MPSIDMVALAISRDRASTLPPPREVPPHTPGPGSDSRYLPDPETVYECAMRELRPTAEQEAIIEDGVCAKDGNGVATAWRDAVAKVLEGFDRGIFVRSTDDDGDAGWVVRLLPYITALAVLRERSASDPEPSPTRALHRIAQGVEDPRVAATATLEAVRAKLEEPRPFLTPEMRAKVEQQIRATAPKESPREEIDVIVEEIVAATYYGANVDAGWGPMLRAILSKHLGASILRSIGAETVEGERIEGTAFLDGDAFCSAEVGCRASYTFVPECKHEPVEVAMNVAALGEGEQRATLILHPGDQT